MGGISSQKTKASGPARVAGCFAWVLILALLGGGGYWGYRQWRDRPPEVVEIGGEVGHLERGFEIAMEKRRLEEADLWIERLESAGARAGVLQAARERVAQGRAEERGQEIAFLLLKAEAALDEGELPKVERLCVQLEKLDPKNVEIVKIRKAADGLLRLMTLKEKVGEVENALEKEDWEEAGRLLGEFDKAFPGEAEVVRLREAFEMRKEEARIRQLRAAELVGRARELDDGEFSDEAVRLLEEAVSLDPSEENKALYQQMSAYGRVLEVPMDHASITAALKVAKANDRIMVANGVYQESLRMPAGVTLVGESLAGTVIECPAEMGAVVTVPTGIERVRLASLTLRHSGLVNEDERFSIVTVDGGAMEGDDLRLVRASGHGVAVLNGGKVRLQRCLITDSGWDGVAVTGEGSHAELSRVRAEKNLQHGVDFWDGAGGKMVDSVVSGNGLNGILVIDSKAVVEVWRTKSEKNHEIGVVVSGGVGFELKESEISGNLLGGVFLGQKSRGIRVEGNRITENGEAGMVVEKGAEMQAETNNEVVGNEGRQVWRDAVLPEAPGVQTGAPPPAPPLEGEDDE